MANCLVCDGALKTGQRRKISIEAKSIMMNLLSKSEDQSEVDQFLNNYEFVCKSKCLLMVDNVVKFKKKSEELQSLLEQKVISTFKAHKLPSQRTYSKAKRRILHDTPTRNVTSQPITGESPVVSVIVKKKESHRVHRLTKSLKTLGRSVGRLNRKSIVRQVIRDKIMRRIVAEKLGEVLHKELLATCASRSNSIYHEKSTASLLSFSWSKLYEDLRRTSPILSIIMEKCVNKKRNQPIERSKHIIIAMAAGILLRSCSQRANIIQRVIGILLYASHAPKQLFTRLYKAGICLSHKRCISLIDELGKHYDELVKQWRDTIAKTLWNHSDVYDNSNTGCQPELQDETEEQHSTDIIAPDLSANSSSTSDGLSDNSEPPSPAISSITSSSHTCSTSSQEFSPTPVTKPLLTTFKIVGDNIDKSVKPRHETSQDHTKSLHYFHSFAVRDRQDVTHIEDFPCLPDKDNIDVNIILPSEEDKENIMNNMAILMGRVIQKHCIFFKTHVKRVQSHIPHMYSKEMSMKSEVIPLGVLLKNETSHEDMVTILQSLQQYVPVHSQEEVFVDAEDNEEITLVLDEFHYVLFGGDQLTVERAVGSKRERCNECRGTDRLEGLVPVIEDWHAKVCFLKAIWKLLYKTSSGIDGGTLYQLRNLVKRRSVTAKIRSDPTACEEFFLLVVEAHILSLVMTEFQLSSLDESPSSAQFDPETFIEQTPEARQEQYLTAIRNLITKYVHVPSYEKNAKKPTYTDHKLAYAKELLSLGLLFMEFVDAIREGDGSRILRCWRYLLLLFKATQKHKYAIQAITMLSQFHYLFSKRMSNQLIWSRTINVHGRPGKNIPMDLHMEHLNRELKLAISHLSSNVSEKAIQRIGMCLRLLTEIKRNYDENAGISPEFTHHSLQSCKRDLLLILKQLNDCNIFTELPGRHHSQFKKFTGGCTIVDTKTFNFYKWMTAQIDKLINYI